MNRSILLLVCALVSMCIASDENHKAFDEYPVKSKEMWLQSHLGHQLRDRRLDELDCDDLEEYIRSIPWSVIEKCAITEDKRDKSKSNQFIPRLGRGFDDLFGSTNVKWTSNPVDGHGFITTRSQFSPRLGRKLPFTPRLGRESLPTW